MRWWLAVIIGLLIGALLVVGMAGYSYRLGAARAGRLLRATLQDGVLVPTSAEANIRVLVASSWHTTKATLQLRGAAAGVTMLEGPVPTELLDDGRRLWRLDPGARTAVATGQSDRTLDWELFGRNYSVTAGGMATIAGRPAQEVCVRARQEPRRIAMRLWIEPPTRLILRRLTYDADGDLVAETRLTRVRPTPEIKADDVEIPPGWQTLDPDGAAVNVSEAEFVEGAGFSPRRPAYVPTGYESQGLYANTCPHGRPYAELRYSDGLRVLSVYQHEPGGRGRMGGGGGGSGRGGGGGGHRWGQRGNGSGRGRHHVGSPDPDPVIIDQGQAKSVRQRRADLMIVVTGDLTTTEIAKVIRSIP